MQERKTIIALQNQAANSDLTDPPQDQEKLKPEDDNELIITGTETDISREEVIMLERMDGFEATADNQNLADARLDNTDMDGEELNEDSFGEDLSGKDLDMAITEQDDPMEEIGEEDEENNIYSDDDQDDTR